METIRNLMEEETWFSCDRALEYGFVDKQMFMKKISREMVASILEHVPEQGRHLFMENVIKKNLDKIDANIDELKSIKNNKNQSYGQKLMILGVKDKKNDLSYGQKLMTIGLTPNKKPTTKQMLRVANDAEKIVMLLTLEARHEALKSIREKRFEQIQKEIKGSYSEQYLNEGYQAGDVILENGKTVLVAQGLNDYQSKADELRR